MPPMNTASVLGERYKPHFGDICDFVAAVSGRYRLLSPMLVLVWMRLRRTLKRLDNLAIRWQSGRLRPARIRVRTERKPTVIHPAEADRLRRTPQGHAWLLGLHQPFAQFIPRIELLLADPDIIALCAAAPQAGRLLRPLCRMFAITPPPHIARPPAPRKPRPKKPKAQKPQPPPFAEHSPSIWPFVPHRLRLRVPGLNAPALKRRKPPD